MNQRSWRAVFASLPCKTAVFLPPPVIYSTFFLPLLRSFHGLKIAPFFPLSIPNRSFPKTQFSKSLKDSWVGVNLQVFNRK